MSERLDCTQAAKARREAIFDWAQDMLQDGRSIKPKPKSTLKRTFNSTIDDTLVRMKFSLEECRREHDQRQ